MRTELAAALAVAGCAAHPLPDVPVFGATSEERSIIEAELVWFSDQIAPRRLALNEIRVAEIEEDEDIAGHFAEFRWRITLRPRLTPANLATVLRHELCHALDFQHGIGNRPHPALDGYGLRLVDESVGTVPWIESDRSRRSEALAKICEAGPAIAEAVAVGCPGEAPVLSDIATFARDHVWRVRPAAFPGDQPIRLRERVEPFQYLSVAATTTPGVLWVQTDAEGAAGQEHAVDLWSGALLGGGEALEQTPWLTSPVDEQWGVEFSVPQQLVGGADHSLMLAYFDIDAFAFEHPDHPQLRLLYQGPDSDGWVGVPKCLPPDGGPLAWDFFAADGELWYAEGDGESVWWSPVRPRL